MNLVQIIQQRVEKFPPDKQAEVLDFVLFLEQKLEHSIHHEDEEWQALQQQKSLYADRFPPSVIESPDMPSYYIGKPLSIEEMQDRAKRAVAERFKNG